MQIIKELGTIKFGEPHNFTFTVKNTLSTPIDIDKITVGCTSCTKVHTDTWYINVGDGIIIDVIFTPGALGIQTKRLYIMYNDGEEMILKFKSTVYE